METDSVMGFFRMSKLDLESIMGKDELLVCAIAFIIRSLDIAWTRGNKALLVGIRLLRKTRILQNNVSIPMRHGDN